MTSSAQETGALAVRETSGAAIVKAVPIPQQLQELGVRIAEEEGTGLRVIVLPPDVRQAVNLLTPVSSWAQADPNWTPSVALVKLDKDAHTYPLPGSKLGLNKQALETLGKCAGVLYTRTSRVPHTELQPGEDYAYRATVGFRRSDGTIDEVTRERGYQGDVEQADIEDAVTKGGKHGARDTASWNAEVRKRMIAEKRFGPAKTESKAINRALRAGLAMPASVNAADLNKPFLVVGFNFTPDYNDPVQRAALVQIAHLRTDQIYGGRDVSDQMPEIGAGDIPADTVEAPAMEPPDTDGAEGVKPAPPVSEQAGVGAEPLVTDAGSSPEPTLDGGEPQIEFGVPTQVVDQALQTPIASQSGKTLAVILDHAESEDWFRWAVSESSTLDPDEQAAVEIVVRERLPHLLAEAA